MTAIDIACRACASQPKQLCRTDELDRIVYQEEFHPERILDATGIDQPGGLRITNAAMHEAAEAIVDQMF